MLLFLFSFFIIAAGLLHIRVFRHLRDGDIPPRFVAAHTLVAIHLGHDTHGLVSDRSRFLQSRDERFAGGRLENRCAQAFAVLGIINWQGFTVERTVFRAVAVLRTKTLAAHALAQSADAGKPVIIQHDNDDLDSFLHHRHDLAV
jgi:hypothetical protein